MDIAGLKVVVSALAYKTELGERSFPVSKHRSRRIHKKLVRRYGSEYKIKHTPMAYRMGSTLIVHPSLLEEIKRHAAQSQPDGSRLLDAKPGNAPFGGLGYPFGGG